MKRRIFAGFTIRKRLPIRIFGSTIYETIRIPISPAFAFLVMVAEWLLGRATDNHQNDSSEE